MLDLITNKRLRLALKVLDHIYNPAEIAITRAEVKELKLLHTGSTDGMLLEEIAASVIHGELDRIKNAPAEHIQRRQPCSTGGFTLHQGYGKAG